MLKVLYNGILINGLSKFEKKVEKNIKGDIIYIKVLAFTESEEVEKKSEKMQISNIFIELDLNHECSNILNELNKLWGN